MFEVKKQEILKLVSEIKERVEKEVCEDNEDLVSSVLALTESFKDSLDEPIAIFSEQKE